MSFRRYRLTRTITPEELEWLKSLGVKLCNTYRFDTWYGHQIIEGSGIEFETLSTQQSTVLQLRFGNELIYIKEAEL